MKFNVISVMPQLIESGLEFGVVGSAFKKEICQLNCVNPRQFASDNHQSIDDRPFGGGDGMLMMAEPLQQALDSIDNPGDIYFLSPQGEVLNDKKVRELSQLENLTLICGRYGGVDQRFLNKHQIKEISIGDYVLSGGELAALVLIDATVRQRPNVLGHSASANEDSFAQGLLEPAYFTRPQVWDEASVPALLLSGDHKKINELKYNMAILTTLVKKPELLKKQQIAWQKVFVYVQSLAIEDLKAFGFDRQKLMDKIQGLIHE